MANFIYTFKKHSLNTVNFIIEEGAPFKIKNDCLVSQDEKDLYFIFERDNIVIPDKVEHIHYRSFVSKFSKLTSKVTWPRGLKVIDELSLKPEDFAKIVTRNPLPDTLEVLNKSTILPYIRENNLYIPKNIKEITPGITSYMEGVNNVYVNNNFIYENKFLLTKDRKTLILCLDKRNKNVLFLPESIEIIQDMALNYISDVKTIIIKRKNDNLIKQIENYNKYNRYNFKVEVLKPNSIDKIITSTNIINEKPEYIVNKSKCYISNNLILDKLEIGISAFPEGNKKTFVLTKECANIKELILPEGITDIEIDSSCYAVEFNMEILEVPSSCKFSNILEKLDAINNFMLLIINPIKKPKWMVHKLSYVVACKSDFSMPKGVFSDYESYSGFGSQEYSVINEITYLKNFDRNKLIITDKAYYYVNNVSKKEVGLIKVKNLDHFSLPERVDKYKVKKIYDYCYSKYNGTLLERNSEDLAIDEEIEETETLINEEEYYETDETATLDEEVSDKYNVKCISGSIYDLFSKEEIEKLKNQLEQNKNNNNNDDINFYSDLKIIFNIQSNKEKICNVEFKFNQDNIPLILERYLDESSIFEAALELLINKELFSEIIKEGLDINPDEYSKLTNIEKALVIVFVMLQNYYDYTFDISLKDDSKEYLNETIGESKVVNKIFELCSEESSMIINVLPAVINGASNNLSLDINLNLDTMILTLDELFTYLEGDIEDDKILGYNLFYYNYESLEEVEEMNDEAFISCLSEDENNIFVDIIEEHKKIDKEVTNDIELLKWITENHVGNILKYNNKLIRYKLPSYMLDSNEEGLKDSQLSPLVLSKVTCPNVSISLNGCFDVASKVIEAPKIIKEETPMKEETKIENTNEEPKIQIEPTKRNNGYIAKNEMILAAKDFITAIDLASNEFSKNHLEQEAIDLSKKMKITISGEYCLYTKVPDDKPVSVTFNRKKGVQFSCYCNEYKTKTNPCVHCRALYYVALENERKSNNNTLINDEEEVIEQLDEKDLPKEKQEVESIIDDQSKKKNKGYTVNTEKIKACQDMVSAIDVATNDFRKNHDEEEAINYAKELEVTYRTKYHIRARNKDNMFTTANVTKQRGVEFTCECDEYKTKTNPCCHIRAMYYIASNINNNSNNNELDNEYKNEEINNMLEKASIKASEVIINETNISKNNDLNDDYEIEQRKYSFFTYIPRFNFNQLGELLNKLGILAFFMVLVAIVCSYLTTATLTYYAINEGEIVGRAYYSEVNIGKICGFFYILMFIMAMSPLSIFFIEDKSKHFIPYIMASVGCFISCIIFSSCMNKYDFAKDLNDVPYSNDYMAFEAASEISGPGGIVVTLFIVSALIYVVQAIVKYKKENY